MPALEVTTGEQKKTLNQSNAILRYIAKMAPAHELYPSDAFEAARVDAICDQEADALSGLRVSKYKERFGFGFLADEANAPLLADVQKNVNGEIIPRHLGLLAKHLEAGGTGWIAGTAAPSIADFVWAPTIASLAGGASGDATVVDAFPTLLAFKDKFYALPAVEKYYADKAAAAKDAEAKP